MHHLHSLSGVAGHYEILGLDLWPGDKILDYDGTLLGTVGPEGACVWAEPDVSFRQ